MNGDHDVEMVSQQMQTPGAGPSNSQSAPQAVATGTVQVTQDTAEEIIPTGKPTGQPARTGPKTPQMPLEPLEEVMRRRTTKVKEGDNVLLRLPSDTVKAVVASKEG